MNLPRPERGFTLIELIILIVVFFGSVTSLLSVAIEAAKRVGENNDSVIAMQLAQEQAEYFIAVRRKDYNLILKLVSTDPTVVTGYPGFTRSYSISDCSANYLGMINGCRFVAIDVAKGATLLATVKLLLANY